MILEMNANKYLGEPFVNNCGYNLAKAILKLVNDSTLNQRQEDYPDNNVINIDHNNTLYQMGKKQVQFQWRELRIFM